MIKFILLIAILIPTLTKADNLISSYINKNYGITIPNYNYQTQSIVSMTGDINGQELGYDRVAHFDCGATYKEIQICSAYLKSKRSGQNSYTIKVVDFKINKNMVWATGAREMYQHYDKFTTDYTDKPVASSYSDPGYGLHNIEFQFGAKEINIRDKLPAQWQLQQQMDKGFFKILFSQTNNAVLYLENGYWRESINYYRNSGLFAGSNLTFRTVAGWDTKLGTAYTLERDTVYQLVFNSNEVPDLNRSMGSNYITTNAIDVPSIGDFASPVITAATMNGSSVGGDYTTTIKNRGNGIFDAYFYDGHQYTKVVTLSLSNGKLKVIAAKYREGQYAPDATDYQAQSIATSNTSHGYGVHSVVVTYPW